MALIGSILGLGRTAEQVGAAVGNVAEVFVGNRAEREAAAAGRLRRGARPVRGRVRPGPARLVRRRR